MILKNKTVIVTGGAAGIGKAVAMKMAEEGCHVVIADVDEENGRLLSQQIPDSLFVKCNIADEKDVLALRDKTMEKYGSIDVLINNAAVQTEADLDHTTIHDFRRVVDTNLVGTFIVSSVINKEMKKGSTILNMLSVHYEKPRLNKFGYDASKAGIAIMTQEMALALSEKGITVNGISYGAVKTPMNADWTNDPVKSEKVTSNIPLKWIAESEEIALYVKEIIGTFSDHSTGSIFTIDGGRRLK